MDEAVSRKRYILTPLAAALVAMQALWSGLAATAYAAGVDEARFLCAQLALPAEARAQIAELAALMDDEPANEAPVETVDCAACSLGKAPAIAADLVSARAPSIAKTPPARISAAKLLATHPPTGPPVGLRAPPVLI